MNRYKHMAEETWLMIIGVPVIAVLAALAWRRARAVTRRIAEVQAELARNPQNPYLMLAELMQEPQNDAATASPRDRGHRWPKD